MGRRDTEGQRTIRNGDSSTAPDGLHGFVALCCAVSPCDLFTSVLIGYGEVACEEDMGVLRVAERNKLLEVCCSSSSPLSRGMLLPSLSLPLLAQGKSFRPEQTERGSAAESSRLFLL